MKATAATLAVAALVSAGCPRATALDVRQDVVGPVVVGEHLAYLDRARERVTLLAPLTGEVRDVPLGRRPSFVTTSTDHRSLYALTRGWLATAAGEITEEARLYVVDPATGDASFSALPSPFDRITASDDGRFAIAFFAADAAPGDAEVFRNPNSVAIIDLDSGEVHAKNVRSFGDIPIGVVFSPSTMAPLDPSGGLGAQRTLAVVFAPGALTLLDIAAPQRREVTVRLSLPGASRVIVPDKLVFVPEAGAMYLKADGTNDIFVLTLTTRAPDDETQNDFVVSVNTLAAGTAPADLLSFVDGGRRKILVANQGSKDLTVIDGLTSEFFTLPVGEPVDRVLGHPAEDPRVAIVFSQAARRRSVHVLALTDVDGLRGRALTTLEAAAPIAGMQLVPDRSLALMMHEGDDAAVSILDIDDGTLSPVTGRDALDDLALTPDGSGLAGTTTGRQDRLGIIDLATVSSRALVLDDVADDILALHPLDDDDRAADRAIIVVHADETGRVTVVPDALRSEAADLFVLSGFLVDGLLDEPAAWGDDDDATNGGTP